MRAKNPIRYAFDNLRDNSKRRGIAFDLTFEQFKIFCYCMDYIKNKGTTKKCWTIDRKDNSKGYTLDNIQILTMSENARKGKKKLEFDEEAFDRGLGFRMRVVTIKKPEPLGGRGEF